MPLQSIVLAVLNGALAIFGCSYLFLFDAFEDWTIWLVLLLIVSVSLTTIWILLRGYSRSRFEHRDYHIDRETNPTQYYLTVWVHTLILAAIVYAAIGLK